MRVIAPFARVQNRDIWLADYGSHLELSLWTLEVEVPARRGLGVC